MKTSASIAELMPDLVKAQLQLKNPIKDQTGTVVKDGKKQYEYQYFDLAGLREHSATILAQHNLAIVQSSDYDDHGNFVLYTRLYHKSGEWIESRFPLPTNVRSQEIGSAMTYARRYSWAAMIGLHGDKDTDGKEGTVPAISKAFSRQTLDPLSDPVEDRNTPSPYASKTPYEALITKLKSIDDVEELMLWWGDITPTRNNQLNGAWQLRLFIEFLRRGCDAANNRHELEKFWNAFAGPRAKLASRDPEEAAELEKLYDVTYKGFNLGAG